MISKEFKVGLLALVAGCILYFGFKYLKGINMFSDSNHYYAAYERIDGLQVSNPVMVNGFIVGRVSNISIMQNQGNQMLVELELESDLLVGNASEAQLADNGLLGGKMIDLKLIAGTGNAQEFDTLKSLRVEPMTALLQEKAAPLMEGVDTIMVNVNTLISNYANMSESIKTLVDNASAATVRANQLLANNQQDISATLKHFNALSAKLLEQQKQIDPILSKLNVLGDSLTQIEVAALSKDMRTTLAELNSTMGSINKAEGNVGKLMKDEALYENMNQTVKDLDSLFIDLKENPKRYVHFSLFGKKDKEKKGE